MTKNRVVTKSLVALAALAAIGGGASLAVIASAQTPAAGTTPSAQTQKGPRMGPGVMGTIASISGNSITVTGKNGTTYTVDVSNAKVMIGSTTAAPTAGSVSSLKVGDTVGVRGTVSGTSVTATAVVDGVMPHGFGPGMRGKGMGIMGTVSAVNGNTITVTNKDGTSYTVDASSAKVSKTTSINVSDIQVGDTVGVQGTTSGTSVKAAHIMDGVPPTPQAPPASN